MPNTTIQGAKIKNLVSKLETALFYLDDSGVSVQSKPTETIIIKATQKCYKCSTTC